MYKKIVVATFLFTGPLIASFTPFFSGPEHAETHAGLRERNVRKRILSQIVSFRDYVKDSLFYEVSKNETNGERVRQVVLTARLLFKKFEWGATYFAADLAERLNGPPVPEIENADLLDPSLARAIDPVGLQVIEELIYPENNASNRQELIDQVAHLVTNTDYLIAYFTDHELADWRILDAAKLEVFRIITLGITGFDNALSLNSMEESSVSLQSLHDVLSRYVPKKKMAPLLQQLDAAIAYLHRHPDFDSFDRAAFITRFANGISAGIAQLEQDLPGPKIKYNRMLNQNARTLFDPDAFNVNAFSPGPEFHVTAAKVALGEKLFYDAALSGTGTRSCASCHNPSLAYADGLVTPADLRDPTTQLTRNVPTLLNVALQSNYFYDMRALTLEDQVRDVIRNPQEMGNSMAAIIRYLSADTPYLSLFTKAFPAKDKNEISRKEIIEDEVVNALASYLRSLTKLNSRFDAYMHSRGEGLRKEDILSKRELNGFNLFMGKAKCATCHFLPLFNGVTPPKYVKGETEVLGVPVSAADSTLDPDRGYYDIIGIDSYQYAFKIPTVRNIAKTAPYMHNGAFQTLDEVMEFYNNGGAAGLGINLPNQTLPEESLDLTESEKQDIIAFMRSLESR
ncbi:cytochrome-c peroxidase [Parapedobacter indicus]|uniref:Cytochrome c peroxidase n=1 Tax=Parapedobacter indicus TaxID=1477437 RepID=A0A1I3QVI0_9SPHI|nr:cytochrome c peroxidase [Parapedobacter indicus]PPL00230.1 cytochrome c peroxidase [Parapedobacter indicus]SFJ37116.1 cytochrome c peroxidase [Parapedobacter indicus]